MPLAAAETIPNALQGDFAAPVRTNKYPREIPELPWYRSAIPQMVMAGARWVLELANSGTCKPGSYFMSCLVLRWRTADGHGR